MLVKSSTPARLFLWPDRALVLGVSFDSRLHAHFATQISFGLHGPFRARLGADGPLQETRAAIFAPHAAHQLDSGGQLLAHLFIVLPRSADAIRSQLDADFAQRDSFNALQPRLLQLAQSKQADAMQDAEEVLQQWLACAMPEHVCAPIGATLASARAQQRIAVIHAHIQTCLQQGQIPSTEALAALIHLSPSRFLHFFREQCGMSLARYLLWVRLQLAIQAIAAGANITNAAHVAGFADTAHMSRSFRATIGIAASDMQKIAIAFKPLG